MFFYCANVFLIFFTGSDVFGFCLKTEKQNFIMRVSNASEETFILTLPRVYEKDNPPKILVSKTILNLAEIKISKETNNLAFEILNKLYSNKKMSQSELAKLFRVQTDTIRNWLKRLNINLRPRYDEVSRLLSKHKKPKFLGKFDEKAYFLGLRTGDIHAQRHGRNIRVSVTSTHPAMTNLFRETFSKYGEVKKYSKKPTTKSNFYAWSLYCDLDNSFDFMLVKPKEIPEYILKQNKSFFSFLSAYFDCEGCISIYANKNRRNAQWILKSCDKQILFGIFKKMKESEFDLSSPKKVKEADFENYNKDYWFLGTGIKSQILTITKKTKLRHQEKIEKTKLLSKLEKTNWKDSEENILSFRKKISKARYFFCKTAADDFAIKKQNH